MKQSCRVWETSVLAEGKEFATKKTVSALRDWHEASMLVACWHDFIRPLFLVTLLAQASKVAWLRALCSVVG
jgi:hypothetical protein